ncbi:MAG: T9SS type A sorting domain-containing protein [Bacteroidetes bacterium]|nr:T9SS type A sorting domain-containing protein [Bacteroidota bacterium]
MKKHCSFIVYIIFLAASSLLFCVPAKAQSAYELLSGNNIKARFNANGLLFWDGKKSAFVVPANSKTSSVSASGIWIGGYDSKNFLHTAAQGYNDLGSDFYPGALDSNGKTDSLTSLSFNKVWKITRLQIDSFRAGLSTPNAIKNWPANGNTAKGFAAQLAPFVDVDFDGKYDYTKGDYPKMEGDAMLWFVYNDNLKTHAESHGRPLGVEIQVSAYAYNCHEEALQNAIFLKYKIINRSAANYDSTFIGLWADFDMGNPFNDYVGCDSTNNSFFVYDGVSYDRDTIIKPLNFDTISYKGYGKKHGVQSVTFFNGIKQNNGTAKPMSRFMYYLNDTNQVFFPQGNPRTDHEYYNYLSGTWQNGKPLKTGGDGLSGNNISHYAFPDFPLGKGWNEITAQNKLADRKAVGSFGPFSFKSHDEIEFTAAFIFSTAEDGRTKYALHRMQTDVAKIQDLYNKNGLSACTALGNCNMGDSCVFPGDADNNKKADMYDIFRMGYAFGEKGNARTNASNTWQGQKANNWGKQFPDGLDFKFADANGDGIIDSADVLPIVYNYSQTHNKKEQETATNSADVKLIVDVAEDSVGTSGEANVTIRLADGGSGNKHSVYGVAFALDFDSLVKTNSGSFDISASYLGKPTELLVMQTEEPSKKKTNVAVVRRDKRGKFDPTGVIIKYKYVITDNVSGGVKIKSKLSINEARIVDSNLTKLSFDVSHDSFYVYQNTTAIRDYLKANRNISLYPNPASTLLMVNFKDLQPEKISIHNIYGQEVYSVIRPTETTQTIDVSNLPHGIYFLQVLTEGAVVSKKFVK